jgi:competence protein ComEC
LLRIAHTVADWPAALLAVPQMPAWGLLTLSGGLVWLCLWRTHLRFAGLFPLALGAASPWLVAPPDIMVSADARVIAVRAGGQVMEHASNGADRFALEMPGRVWGRTPVSGAPIPAIGACAADACHLTLARRTVLLVLDPSAQCDGATVVLSSLPLHGRCTAALVIDRFSVLNDGATSITFTASGFEKVTDHGMRGSRPWVISAQTPAAASRLPPAATE